MTDDHRSTSRTEGDSPRPEPRLTVAPEEIIPERPLPPAYDRGTDKPSVGTEFDVSDYDRYEPAVSYTREAPLLPDLTRYGVRQIQQQLAFARREIEFEVPELNGVPADLLQQELDNRFSDDPYSRVSLPSADFRRPAAPRPTNRRPRPIGESAVLTEVREALPAQVQNDDQQVIDAVLDELNYRARKDENGTADLQDFEVTELEGAWHELNNKRTASRRPIPSTDRARTSDRRPAPRQPDQKQQFARNFRYITAAPILVIVSMVIWVSLNHAVLHFAGPIGFLGGLLSFFMPLGPLGYRYFYGRHGSYYVDANSGSTNRRS